MRGRARNADYSAQSSLIIVNQAYNCASNLENRISKPGSRNYKKSARVTRSDRQTAADQKKSELCLAREIRQKESDNRFTSPTFICALEASFGKIDFDPCWHAASAVNPKAYLDVRLGHNGLRDEWYGQFVFVNPPWSAQDKWVKRVYDQWRSGNVGTVVCLVPAKTDTKFFHAVLSRHADVYFIEGRPHFFKVDGTSQSTMVSAMLVIFGATDRQKMRLAEFVRGSWWLPERRPAPRTKKVGAASFPMARANAVASYIGRDQSLVEPILTGCCAALTSSGGRLYGCAAGPDKPGNAKDFAITECGTRRRIWKGVSKQIAFVRAHDAARRYGAAHHAVWKARTQISAVTSSLRFADAMPRTGGKYGDRPDHPKPAQADRGDRSRARMQ